jgi:hypothetical protein
MSFRQPLTEPPVRFTKTVGGYGSPSEISFVDPALDSDMRSRFELQIAPPGIGAIVILQGPLDFDRMRVVPFDEIAEVAIHRADESSERSQHAGRQTAAKTR